MFFISPYRNIEEVLIVILFFALCFGVPAVLTIWNIYNCFSGRPKKEKLISSLTILVGGLLYMLLYAEEFEEAGDWYEQVNSMQCHYSIASEYQGIIWIAVIGLIGYFVLLFVKAEKLPPLLSALCIAMIILLNVLQIVFAIQIWKNDEPFHILFYVYHFNILLLSARAIHQHMKQQVAIFRSRSVEMEEHKGFQKFFTRIESLSQYAFLIFLVLFFAVAVIEIIFVLAGQGIDAPIKAFTETADWTFSKQIPPPPSEYDGHYLCTVAAGGHRKIVKPLRLGKRRGEIIVVNRQLCIANAFEEVIQEKFPRLHHKIRHAYDTYGYPLSRRITSPVRADVVYFLMKPLEWGFLIFLYLFDCRPEQRIGRQYIARQYIWKNN